MFWTGSRQPLPNREAQLERILREQCQPVASVQIQEGCCLRVEENRESHPDLVIQESSPAVALTRHLLVDPSTGESVLPMLVFLEPCQS